MQTFSSLKSSILAKTTPLAAATGLMALTIGTAGTALAVESDLGFSASTKTADAIANPSALMLLETAEDMRLVSFQSQDFQQDAEYAEKLIELKAELQRAFEAQVAAEQENERLRLLLLDMFDQLADRSNGAKALARTRGFIEE